MKEIHLLLVLLFTTTVTTQKNPNFAENKQVIVNLFEWKWTDVAIECETFLTDKGYGGVQISPPNENIVASARPWWERYQPVSYNLTTRSGNELEFSDMVSRCNGVGIRIYADVVLNHMAALSGTGTAGNKALSDVKSYPAVPYNPEHFHPTCSIVDYLDPDTVRNCELNQMRDLDQSTQYVQDKLVEYLNHLIDLGVAGFRIDSAKYIAPHELDQLYSNINDLNTDFGFEQNSRPFIYQDVPMFDYGDVIFENEYNGIGTVVEANYSNSISRIFSRGEIASLEHLGLEWGFLPSDDAVVFVDNHVNQRKDVLNYKTPKLYKMATAFTLAYNYGIPKIMSSYYFYNQDIGPPQTSNQDVKSPIIYTDGSCGNGYVCEHRWPQIYKMVEFKITVQGTELTNWWSNGTQQIAFSREDKGFIAFSKEGNLTENIQTSLPAGVYCDIISGYLDNGICSGKTVVIDENGLAAVSVYETDYDGVVAIHINNRQ